MKSLTLGYVLGLAVLATQGCGAGTVSEAGSSTDPQEFRVTSGAGVGALEQKTSGAGEAKTSSATGEVTAGAVAPVTAPLGNVPVPAFPGVGQPSGPPEEETPTKDSGPKRDTGPTDTGAGDDLGVDDAALDTAF